MTIRALPPLLVFLLVSLTTAGPALAQGTGRSMDIDVSIRSAGMGGASSAVFWGDDLNHWSNPALLGLVTGVRYERGNTQLVPDLSPDVTFESRVLKAGGGGIGFVWSQNAPGPGGVHLDYGSAEWTDGSGNPIGVYDSWEQVDSWGFGISVLRALGTVLGRNGGDLAHDSGGELRRLDRWFDVGFGMNFKQVAISLGPSIAGKTDARDWGVLVRVSPLDLLESEGSLPLRFDLAYAHSVLSANDDATIEFFPGDAERVSRHRRDGVAGRVAFTPPAITAQANERTTRGALVRGFLPLVSLGGAYEWATIDAGDGLFAFKTTGSGGELGIANVFALRLGSYSDRTGGIEDGTMGWSAGLPIGPWGGFRYMRATWPEGAGLSDLDRDGWTFWVNPLAVLESARSR